MEAEGASPVAAAVPIAAAGRHKGKPLLTKVLVGTSSGLYELSDAPNIRLAGHEITWIGKNDSGLWSIVGGSQIWHRDSDADWQPIASVDSWQVNCLLLTSSGTLVGTSEAHLLALRDSHLETVHSFEQAEGREDWFTPWGGPPDVRSMSAGPEDTIYVNVHVGGVLRSEGGGQSWRSTIDIQADVHQVLCHPGSGLVLAATAHGLAVSADGGRSWKFAGEGLHAHYLRAVAVAEETVLVTASTGPATRRAALYRKPLEGGRNFERCESGLPEWFSANIDTFCMAASGSQVAFGTSEGKIFASPDQGRSWTVAAEGLPAVRCITLV